VTQKADVSNGCVSQFMITRKTVNRICCLGPRKPKIEICRASNIDAFKVIVTVKIVTGIWESRHALLFIYY